MVVHQVGERMHYFIIILDMSHSRLNLMYVHFTNGDPLKFVVLSNRLKYAANHKLGVLINADVDKVRG